MPAYALAHGVGGVGWRDWIASLSREERAVLPWCYDVWLRPDQRIPRGRWRTCGMRSGRGFGKTLSCVADIHRRVSSGNETYLALIAPTADRVHELQLKALEEYSPPWFKPERKTTQRRQFIVWPNGVEAGIYTPIGGEHGRGDNFSLVWASEIVAWPASTRMSAYKNLASACRRTDGKPAQIIWDSTAKGRNDLLTYLYAQHDADPDLHRVIDGTMFDNPLLGEDYLRSEYASYAGVRRREEIFGEHFDEADGALWKQEWLDRTRIAREDLPELVSGMVGVDPAYNDGETPGRDEWGIMAGGADALGHAYLTHDVGGKLAPNEAFDRAISLADPRTRGRLGGRMVLERNQGGEMTITALRSRADTHNLLVVSVARDAEWPRQEPDVIHVREHHAREGKDARATGPAGEHEAGRVHLVGEYPDLENQLTTWVIGRGKSPNRLDAFAYLVIELRGLALEKPRDRAADAAAATLAQKALTEALAGAPRASSPGAASWAGGSANRWNSRRGL